MSSVLLFLMACNFGSAPVRVPELGLDASELGKSNEEVAAIRGAPDSVRRTAGTATGVHGSLSYDYEWVYGASAPPRAQHFPQQTLYLFKDDKVVMIKSVPEGERVAVKTGSLALRGQSLRVRDLPSVLTTTKGNGSAVTYKNDPSLPSGYFVSFEHGDAYVTVGAMPLVEKTFDPTTNSYGRKWTHEVRDWGVDYVVLNAKKAVVQKEGSAESEEFTSLLQAPAVPDSYAP